MVSAYRQVTWPRESIISCMGDYVGRGAGADDAAAGTIQEQAVERLLHLGQLSGHLLPQPVVVTQLLRAHAPHQPLSLLDQLVQLRAGGQVEVSEALEELGQVGDGAVAEDA